MTNNHGYVALFSFVISLATFFLWEYLISHQTQSTFYYHWIQLFNYKLLCLLNKCIYRHSSYQVSTRASFLGYTFSLGLVIFFTTSQSWGIFGVYAAILSVFHLTEYLAIAFTNPAELSLDTFVLNHSTAYTVAAGLSWIEFFIEKYYYPPIKENLWIPLIGLLFCACGEILRKAAIFTAKRNFNHVVQNEKRNDHMLVTHGIYGICRHPSYVGWFYWSIGTQLILQNGLCVLLYTFLSWKFFHDRILMEELSLIRFFGRDYVKYQEKVGTGLPFIQGLKNFY